MTLPAAETLALPRAPSLAVGLRRAMMLSVDGEIVELDHAQAAARIRSAPVYLCHAAATARRVGGEPGPALDLLELFAFVRPATFCLPTARGLAIALDLPLPRTLDEEAALLPRAAHRLLDELARGPERRDPGLVALARTMAAAGWPWGGAVLAALGAAATEVPALPEPGPFAVWTRLAEWEDEAPPPPPADMPVAPEEARARLADLLGDGAEPRPQQADYAAAVAGAFRPRAAPDAPNVVLAEAGTGVGKTLGYVAPASLWAERNQGAVWFSTYTRNLQHQIDRELDRLVPDPVAKARRVVVRKGRENYFCLLNMEERARGVAARPGDAVALGLMARWAGATRDGDMTGGDFPAWLVDLLGGAVTLGLADRRGECIYSACPHYRRCYIERTVRRARRADLVVANHALVMVQAALGGGEDMRRVTRFVFDEGHHLFDAADAAFSAHLSALETAELRRWLLGAEGRRRSRARGLRRRLDDLVMGNETNAAIVEEVLRAAACLPGEGWRQRIAEAQPATVAESFLAEVRRVVYARAADTRTPYSLECDLRPADDDLLAAARELEGALGALAAPLRRLVGRLTARLEDEADSLDSDTRRRLETAIRSLLRRGAVPVEAWQRMLRDLDSDTPDEFVDWLAADRTDGRDVDVGMHRHWVDPMIPFAAAIAEPAHGLVVTSATLRDGTGDAETDWRAAEDRTGGAHFAAPPERFAVASPFDYGAATRVFVVTDVRKDDLSQVAAAYRALFLAAQGGALGLFTAIARLRAVHGRLADPLDEAGLRLLAQHVDPLNTATLVEMFRADADACLLGTDAVRDGVDVPGDALRLIVFDRVPWPRPTILHRVRRDHFGKRRYDDMLTRLRLKQAYGRLIRSNDDRGIFVLLDPMMPSRLKGAFPEGVEVARVGLAEAVAETRAFLAR